MSFCNDELIEAKNDASILFITPESVLNALSCLASVIFSADNTELKDFFNELLEVTKSFRKGKKGKARVSGQEGSDSEEF